MNDSQKGSGVKTVTRCRICRGGQLTEFFNLGDQPLANSFLKKEDLDKREPVYPLRVLFCADCNLVQLGEVVDPEVLFANYVYFSSGMPASRHWQDYAKSVAPEFIRSPEDLIVEIGSNDGHFLEIIKSSHGRILGVDPAKNIAALANSRGIPTIADFFSEKVAARIAEEQGPAKMIVANNVVAHVDDLHDLFAGIEKLLTRDGVFIMEAPYLVDMFENLAFDTIYHEHLSYLALRPLANLFARFNLAIFDVKAVPIQGNSIRVFAARKGTRNIEPSVETLLRKEKNIGFDKLSSYFELAGQIAALKDDVVNLLKSLKEQGKRIIAYGAPAKGNTLLNYYQIGPDVLDFATEELPSKIGVYTPGMKIPVFHVDRARQNPPDFYFLLAWNYKNVVLNEKEKAFRAKGGKFIMPVGRERII